MDIDHYSVEKGQGEPLILLHGNGENCDYFKGQIDEFARYYHVYALDTRGHGKTPRGSAPFTIRQFADDLLEFMDSHSIDKGIPDSQLVIIKGNHFIANKNPEAFNKAVLEFLNS